MSRISSISSVNGSSFDGRAEAVVVRGGLLQRADLTLELARQLVHLAYARSVLDDDSLEAISSRVHDREQLPQT